MLWFSINSFTLLLLLYWLQLFLQATQLAHILDGRLKELSKDSDQERVTREAAAKTAKDKTKAAENDEKRAAVTEKAKVLVKKRSAELKTKQNEVDLKLAEAVSLNVAQAKELADLKAALEDCEDKWYNEGFADANNSIEPVIKKAWRLAFEEGWLVSLQALGVPEDSPLRDPNQIVFPGPTPAVQNALEPINEEETQSMRKLVEQIDSHVELDEMEATNIPHAGDQPGQDIPLQPTSD